MNTLIRLLRWFVRMTGQTSRIQHWINRTFPRFESLGPGNLNAIMAAMQKAPDGDYYEFGVYKGFSLWFAERIAAALQRQMRFFGFDSFDGLPTPTGVDKRSAVTGEAFARGSFCASKEFVLTNLRNHGSDMNRITLVEGFYDETLKPSLVSELKMRRAAVILVDCDMYESSKTVLRFVSPLLQSGTIVLLDDWGITPADAGQQLAFEEYKKEHPEVTFRPFCEFGWAGRGFVVEKVS